MNVVAFTRTAAPRKTRPTQPRRTHPLLNQVLAVLSNEIQCNNGTTCTTLFYFVNCKGLSHIALLSNSTKYTHSSKEFYHEYFSDGDVLPALDVKLPCIVRAYYVSCPMLKHRIRLLATRLCTIAPAFLASLSRFSVFSLGAPLLKRCVESIAQRFSIWHGMPLATQLR